MQITPLKPQQVSFNPATGRFTALVSLRDAGQTYRYPCEFAAPMTMPATIAAHRLTQMAKQRHRQPNSLRSVAPDPGKTSTGQADLPRAA